MTRDFCAMDMRFKKVKTSHYHGCRLSIPSARLSIYTSIHPCFMSIERPQIHHLTGSHTVATDADESFDSIESINESINQST
mmetsp:Transcript_19132/g.24118  ORF Transcript_19132/g.24118 Transcript_19132/m.24118 type:complete len:82 (-) Transcript_19132:95-340(-)